MVSNCINTADLIVMNKSETFSEIIEWYVCQWVFCNYMLCARKNDITYNNKCIYLVTVGLSEIFTNL